MAPRGRSSPRAKDPGALNRFGGKTDAERAEKRYAGPSFGVAGAYGATVPRRSRRRISDRGFSSFNINSIAAPIEAGTKVFRENCSEVVAPRGYRVVVTFVFKSRFYLKPNDPKSTKTRLKSRKNQR